MKTFLIASASVALSLLPSIAFSQEWNDPAMQYVLDQQIMYSQSDGNFNGAGTVTRLEFTLSVVDHLYPMENVTGCFDAIAPTQPAQYSLLFTDVERTEWYAPRLCAAMRAGLVQGNADGSFRPFSPITKAEASKIMARAYGLPTSSQAMSPWYEGALQSLAMRGALSSESAPQTVVTRSTMAQIFYALRDMQQFSTIMNTPDQWIPSQPASEPAAPPVPAMPVYVPVPEVSAPVADTDDGCAISRVNSPGTALYVLGLEAHPRTAVRPTTRDFDALAKARYENGTFKGPDGGQAASNVLTRCKKSFTRTPAGGLGKGTVIQKIATGGRVPHRFLRAQAEQRGTVDDFRIDRSVGY